MVVPMFLGEYPKGITFLFIYKNGKGNLIVGCPRVCGFIKLSFKALKAILSGSSHKIVLGLLFSKIYRHLAVREKFGIQFQQYPPSPREPCSWRLVLDFQKLRTSWSLLDPGIALFLVSDALNIKPGFGKTAIFPWQPYVTLRLKALASGCCFPVRRLEKEGKEANHPHIATK